MIIRMKRTTTQVSVLQLFFFIYLNRLIVMISPSTDPRTLYAHCDVPLPTSPSPWLKRLVATEKKSHQEARPPNPLGRKAPFSEVYRLERVGDTCEKNERCAAIPYR